MAANSQTHASLLERLHNGTAAMAWEEFFGRYWRLIHAWARKRGCSEHTAEQIVQDRLGEDDLEPDLGGPLDIEQPKEIKTKPLNPKDQDDRIRMVFGLTSNDPLPDVDDGTLLTYSRYLAKNMPFPFEVEHFEETGPFEGKRHIVTVVGLLDPDEYECDEMYGLISEGRIDKREIQMPLGEFEVDEDDPGLQTLADYCYWFWNQR